MKIRMVAALMILPIFTLAGRRTPPIEYNLKMLQINGFLTRIKDDSTSARPIPLKLNRSCRRGVSFRLMSLLRLIAGINQMRYDRRVFADVKSASGIFDFFIGYRNTLVLAHVFRPGFNHERF